MTYSITATVASLCVALGSSAALAGGMATEATAPVIVEPTAVAPAPQFNWTGGYVGIQAGAIKSSGDFEIDGFPDVPTTLDGDGSEIGVFGGFNWQGGSSLVYGVEAEYDGEDEQGSNELDFTSLGPNFGTADLDIEIDRTAALRGRLGYSLGQTMVYATAGVAWVDYTISEGSEGNEYTETGPTVGLGLEHAFGERWTARLDYRYSDFGDIEKNNASWDLKTSEIRAGVAMRF